MTNKSTALLPRDQYDALIGPYYPDGQRSPLAVHVAAVILNERGWLLKEDSEPPSSSSLPLIPNWPAHVDEQTEPLDELNRRVRGLIGPAKIAESLHTHREPILGPAYLTQDSSTLPLVMAAVYETTENNQAPDGYAWRTPDEALDLATHDLRDPNRQGLIVSRTILERAYYIGT